MGESNAARSRFARLSGALIAWFAFILAGVAFAARYAPVVNHAVLGLAAMSPYLMLASGVSALLLLLTRRRLAAAVAMALFAASAVVKAPLFIPARHPAGPSIPIRVLSANVMEGGADAPELVAIASADADLLIAQEVTPEFAAALNALDAEFPYRMVEARSYANGVGIWSRYPLVQSTRMSGYELGAVSVTVRVPGAASDVVALVAHLVGPWPQAIDGWRREIAALPDTLDAVAAAAGNGAVVVAGDLNATADMLPFRQLLANGYHDATEQAGAGLTPTFPANRSIPPLIGIDHILTRNAVATAASTVRIPGSDHLAISATVQVPA